jgi:hypothetical protein
MERGHFGDWVRDYATLTELQTRAVLFPKPPESYLGHNQGKLPIILLPGLLENWQFLKNAGDALSRNGHDVYVIPRLRYNQMNLETASHIIDFFISSHKIKDAVIVAHSKGGIEGAQVLQNCRNMRMIAIATPFNGSTLADHIPFGTFREMSPKNEQLIRLQVNDSVKSRIVSVYPEFDNHIPNKDGSYLEGAENTELKGVNGHHRILESPELIDVILTKIDLWEKERKPALRTP